MSTTPPTIPTITLDISTFSKLPHPPSPPSPEQIRLLYDACTTIGFFYLNVSSDTTLLSLLPQVFQQSQRFFEQSLAYKRRTSDPVLNRGYTGMEEETLDPKRQLRRGDTKEGYYIAEDIPVNHPGYDPSKLSGPNVWPAPATTDDDTNDGEKSGKRDGGTNHPTLDCNEWKNVMTSYHTKMKQIGFRVVQLLAVALSLPPTYFDESFRCPMAVLRLLHYSSEPSDTARGVYACGAHSDYGMVTLLATDENPGLQIRYRNSGDGNGDSGSRSDGADDNDGWMDVPPPPMGTFVVNLGDMLERWTNGRFRSTVHRVITPSSPSDGDSSEERQHHRRERYSVPFFYEPNFDTVVECLPNCRDGGDDDNGGAKYPPITSGRYLLDKYAQTHGDFEGL